MYRRPRGRRKDIEASWSGCRVTGEESFTARGSLAAFDPTILALRDPATFVMIFKCKSIVFSAIGFPSIAFVTYGLGFWGPPFFQRVHHVSASEAGTILGLSAAIGGWAGVTIGSNSGQALTTGMLWGLCAYIVAMLTLVLAAINIEKDQNTREQRAKSLCEKF